MRFLGASHRIIRPFLLLVLITLGFSSAHAEGPPREAPDSGDGQWVSFVVRNHKAHAAVYDPVGQRMLVFGGAANTGNAEGVWALALDGSPTWTRVTTIGTPPVPRSGHTLVYDSARHRLVLFGGLRNGTSIRLNDVWELTLVATPVWTQLNPISPPTGRSEHVAIYDPIRDRMIVQGGINQVTTSPTGGTYALSLSEPPTWSSLASDGPVRVDHSAIYDPVRDRMVIYGGKAYDADLGTSYALNLSSPSNWVQLAPSGSAPARRAHSAIYDPARDRMVVFGGLASSAPLGDTWQLDLGVPSWSQMTPSGSAPDARGDHTAIYDPLADRMIVYGGGATSHAFALAFAGTPAWSTYGDGSSFPVERSFHSAVFDPVAGHMIVFFGDTGYNESIQLGDAWRLSLGQSPSWTQLPNPFSGPLGAGSVAVLDPQRHQAIVTRGFSNRLTLEGVPSWYPQSLPGYYAWDNRSSIYDPVRDRVIVFGGSLGSNYTDELYALNLSGTPAWAPLTAVGSPGPRTCHAAIYDPVRDRMIVFGGADQNGARSDLWALSLSGTPTWTQLSPTGLAPSARSLMSVYYDSRRDRMVMYGGYTYTYSRELWALSLAGTPAWQFLQPTGAYPSERKGQTAVYDPVQDRLILFGGEYQGLSLTRFRDCVALEGDGPVSGPDIRVYPGTVDVGSVIAPVTWNLVVRNDGPSPLSVTQIASSEPTIVASATSFALAPGEQRLVPLTWSPSGVGPMSATITVTSDDPDSPSRVVSVSGSAAPTPRFTTSVDSLHVTMRPYETADVPIQVSSVGELPITFDAWVLGSQSELSAGRPRDGERVGPESKRPSGISPLRAGGPDAFGYTFEDNSEPGGPTGSEWILLENAPLVGPTGNDQLSAAMPMGFAFPFYGQTFTSLRVCTNGWISFSNGSLTTAENTSLPHAGAAVPENLLAVFWDDLDFLGTPRIRYHSDASVTVVEFDSVTRAEGPYRTNTFQVQLRPDGTILYLYRDMNAPDLSSCTIGIQNGARDDGLQVAFDEEYLAGPHVLGQAWAIRFRPPLSYLSVTPRSGSIPAGESLDLTLHFDTSGLPWGEYASVLHIRTNDPFQPDVDLPVRLTVLPPLGAPDGPAAGRLALRFAGRHPARGGATLELAAPARAWVEVEVFDVRGRLVRRLARREFEPGLHLLRWDGSDGAGNVAGAGVYFVRARTGGERADLRVALLR